MHTTTGYKNTAMGNHALWYNTTGKNNVAIGSYALYGASGDNNTVIGTNAGQTTSGDNNVFIGYKAGQSSNASNSLYISSYDDDNSAERDLITGDFSGDLSLGQTGTVTILNDADIDGTLTLGSLSDVESSINTNSTNISSNDSDIHQCLKH